MKLNYSRRNIFLAGVLGILSAFFSYQYLSKKENSMKQNLHSQKVFVVTKDLDVGQILTSAEVELQDVYLPGNRLDFLKSVDDLKNKMGEWKYRVGIPLFKGEIVYLKKLRGGTSDLGLAWNLEENFIAITFQCSRQAGLAGLLRPGDWVHLFWVVDGKSVPLLEKVTVLAVDQDVWGGPKFKNHSSDFSEKENFYITLMAPIEKAPQLALAQYLGNVTILLASPLGKDHFPLNSVNVKSMTRGL